MTLSFPAAQTRLLARCPPLRAAADPVLSPQAWLMLTVLLAWCTLSPSGAWAQSGGGFPDVGQLFVNFSDSSVSIMKLVRWTAFVLGIFIAGLGIFKLKEYSEGGGRVSLKAPVLLTFVGAAMVAFPGMVNTATETLSLGASSGPLLLEEPSVSDIPGMNAAMKGVLLFVKMVGHLAFFRGLLLLKGLGEGQNVEGGVGRVVMHIAGGAAAINIGATAGVLASTFAPGIDIGGLGG